MNAEEELRRILRLPCGFPLKADLICKIMDWDRAQLIESMERHGTFGMHYRSRIINDFWPKNNR